MLGVADMSLADKKCQVCEGGIPALDPVTCKNMLKETPHWELSKNHKYIERKFNFKGFYATMSFVNAVAYIAQKEGHHPDMEVGYNYCNIKFTTHAIDGLSKNDFICAAKINLLI
jgi:4a-hydroxytetrahydrobiopterin dehydratase